MKKRILLVLTDLELGGAPLVARDLAGGLAARGYEMAVASLAGEGPVARDLRERGVATYPLGARDCWDLQVLPRLAHLLQRYRPHVLHCFLVHANVIGRLVGTACGVQHIIASLHTCQQSTWWHPIAETLTCRLSRTTICVSQSVAQHVRKSSHVPASRVRIIPNGIDFGRFANAQPLSPTSLGLDPDKQTILFVGRLDPVKRVKDLLTASVEIIRKQAVQLLIVGDGCECKPLQNLAQNLGIAGDTHFLGTRRDVERILKSADLLVLPSLWEGMPCALLEAMAARVPIAASRTSGVVDLIADGQTGLLFEPGDIGGIAGAVLRLLGDRGYADAMAVAAQDLVRTKFTLDAMLDAYATLYGQI